MKQKDELLSIADGFFNNQEYQRALKYYNQVIELDSKNSLAYEGAGLCYYSLLKVDQAIEYLTVAVVLDPENHNAYYNRGMIWHTRQELHKALEDYEIATAIYGNHLQYLTNCIKVHFLLKNFKKAENNILRT